MKIIYLLVACLCWYGILKGDLLLQKRRFLNLCLIRCFAAIFHFFCLSTVVSSLMLKFLNWSGGFFSLFRFFINKVLTIASGNTTFTGLILPNSSTLSRCMDLQVTLRSTIHLHKLIIMFLFDPLLCSWRMKTILLFALSTR